MGLKADRERLLESIKLLSGSLRGRLHLLVGLLRSLLFLLARPDLHAEEADTRTDRSPLARITGYSTDQCTPRGAAHCAFGSGADVGLLHLLLRLGCLLLGRLSVLGDLERVIARVLHRPVVARGLVNGLLARRLTALGKA